MKLGKDGEELRGESLAIIAVILVMAGMFLRAKKKALAILAMPLISVPATYLITEWVLRLIARSSGADLMPFGIGMALFGVLAGIAACLLLSRMIPTRKAKTGYLAFCLTFQAAITIGYMINIL